LKHISIFCYRKNSHLVLLLLIIFIGLSLRLYNLAKYSFWYDESISIIYSTGNFKTVWTGMTEGVYPSPLYEIFIHYLKKIDSSEFLLRFPSVIFSSISILAIYQLGKLLFDKRVALFSSFIFAISPLHIYYAQEARIYSFVTLLTVLTVIFLIKFLKTEKLWFCFGYAICHILSIYSLYLSILILFAESIFFLIYLQKYRNLFKKWLVTNFVILLFLIPWFIAIFYGLISALEIKGSFWIPAYLKSVSLKNVYITFKNFSVGYNASTWNACLGGSLFITFFLWGIINGKNSEGITIALCCVLIPVFVVFIISKRIMIYVDRHLISSSVFYYIIVARGISKLKKNDLILVSGCIIMLSSFALKNYYANNLSLPFVHHIGVQSKKDHRGAAKYVIENLQEGDGIFHTSENTTHPFEYYFNVGYREYPNRHILPNEYKVILIRPSKKTGKLLFYEHTIQAEFLDESNPLDNLERIWIFFSSWDFETAKSPDSPQLKVIEWMDKHYKRVDKKEFDYIAVYLYRK